MKRDRRRKERVKMKKGGMKGENDKRRERGKRREDEGKKEMKR